MPHLLVTVDSRFRFPDSTPKALIRAMKKAFTHSNPEFFKKKNMGFATWGTPSKIKTFLDDEDGFSVPRGGYSTILELADAEGITLRFIDRTMKSETIEFPRFCVDPEDPSKQLYDFQREALAAIMKRHQGIVRAPTGCLTGDTEIGINRAGKSYRLPLSEVVRRFNGGAAGGKRWRRDIPTMVRSVIDDHVRLSEITSATSSGRKEVFLLRTTTREIKATACHRFLTPNGWTRLDALKPGFLVVVEGERKSRKKKRGSSYPRISGLHAHPYVGRKGVKKGKGGFSVPTHRLTWEAHASGMRLHDFVEKIRNGEVEGLVFVDPVEYAIHHVDRDPSNNHISNLMKVTHEEHRKIHAAKNTNNVQIGTATEQVVSIAWAGFEETFDLTVPDTACFLANDIVVHNSGKTTIAMAAIHAVQQRTMVILRDKQLAKQWKREAVRCLGLPEKEIVMVKGGKRGGKLGPRLSIALQQTLYRKGNRLREILEEYEIGFAIIDEVQGAAARTFLEALDKIPAHYRIGFSADETRKDGKEFLTYDVVGDVLFEVDRAELEERRIVHPVTVKVIPTDFRADWYRDAEKGEKDWKVLLDEMIIDEERNALVLEAYELARSGGDIPAVIFSHRREHARLISELIFEDGYPCGLMIGENDATDAVLFEEARDRLVSGNLKVAAGTFSSLGTGINMPAITSGICATPIGNNRQFFGQVRGRTCRLAPGKETATIFYLWDSHVFPGALRRLMRWNDDRVQVLTRGEWIPARSYKG